MPPYRFETSARIGQRFLLFQVQHALDRTSVRPYPFRSTTEAANPLEA